METFAPGGVDATEMSLGPPCTMICAAARSPIHALNITIIDIRPNMALPLFCDWF